MINTSTFAIFKTIVTEGRGKNGPVYENLDINEQYHKITPKMSNNLL